MKHILQHHETYKELGTCDCGGTIVLLRQDLTVEAGGWPVTRTEYDCFCTTCGDDFAVTANPARESA